MCECLIDEHGEWLCPACADDLRAKLAAAEERWRRLSAEIAQLPPLTDCKQFLLRTIEELERWEVEP